MLHALSSQRPQSISFRLYQFSNSFRSNVSRSISIPHRQVHIQTHQSSLVYNEFLDLFDQFLLQCKTIRESRQVHTQIIVTGAYRSGFLAARVVSVYARLGLLYDAREVFETAPIECFSNVLLWNSILRATVSKGYYEEALEIYYRMRELRVLADGFTFPLVVKACGILGCLNLCRSVHNHVLQMGFQNHIHVVNELVGMYGKLGKMEDARRVFDRMSIRSYISWNMIVSSFALNYDYGGALDMFRRMELEGLEPNLVTWTSLLSSHARCGRREDTLELFDTMRMRGIGATAEAVAVILSVCADLAAVDKGKVIHGYAIKGGFEDYLFVRNALMGVYGKNGDVKCAKKLFFELETKNVVSWNTLITSYAESGLCDEAFEIFSQMEKSDDSPMMRPNVISWSAVIDGFVSEGRCKESLEVFRQMQQANVVANSVTVSTILSACAELAALNFGGEIHGHVVRALMDANILVGNGLINMYMKCGSVKEGQLVFEKLENRDSISWNSIISGYGIHGCGKHALETFDGMIKAGFKPDGVTFIAVLSACSHAGLVAEGRRLFGQMITEYGIEPQMEHYACVVDILGRAGFSQEASKIVRNMPIEPNACVWGALLNSCRMYKYTDVAEETAFQIFGLNSETTGSYMLLSNIYAASGRWEDSARVRISAKTKGLKKTPGQSWIEVKKKIYAFSAGNTLQKGLEEVYEILMELASQMEIEENITGKSLLVEEVNEADKKN